MPPEHAGQQRAVPATDVDHRAEAVEAAHVGDAGHGVAGALRHRLVEHRLLLGVLAHVVERRGPVDAVVGGLAGPHRLAQLAPRPPHVVAREQQHEVAQRGGVVGAQPAPVRSEGVGAGLDLVEDVEARQRPQHAAQRRRVRAGERGQLGRGARPVPEVVGDLQGGRHVQHLGGEEAEQERDERATGGPGVDAAVGVGGGFGGRHGTDRTNRGCPVAWTYGNAAVSRRGW